MYILSYSHTAVHWNRQTRKTDCTYKLEKLIKNIKKDKKEKKGEKEASRVSQKANFNINELKIISSSTKHDHEQITSFEASNSIVYFRTLKETFPLALVHYLIYIRKRKQKSERALSTRLKISSIQLQIQSILKRGLQGWCCSLILRLKEEVEKSKNFPDEMQGEVNRFLSNASLFLQKFNPSSSNNQSGK